jgi:hypothetical protein
VLRSPAVRVGAFVAFHPARPPTQGGPSIVIKINLANAVAVTLMAVVGIVALKWSAAFVPFQGYRDLVGSV